MDLWLGIAVVIATLLGPILAVLVTRWIDNRRQHKSRQMEVFRALMRSRRSALSADYVTALNTVEVEFAGIASVENAQRELFRHLNLTPQPADWIDRLRRLQTRLLYAMARFSVTKWSSLMFSKADRDEPSGRPRSQPLKRLSDNTSALHHRDGYRRSSRRKRDRAGRDHRDRRTGGLLHSRRFGSPR